MCPSVWAKYDINASEFSTKVDYLASITLRRLLCADYFAPITSVTITFVAIEENLIYYDRYDPKYFVFQLSDIAQ